MFGSQILLAVAATLGGHDDACLAIDLPALATQDRAPVLTAGVMRGVASLASSESAGQLGYLIPFDAVT